MLSIFGGQKMLFLSLSEAYRPTLCELLWNINTLSFEGPRKSKSRTTYVTVFSDEEESAGTAGRKFLTSLSKSLTLYRNPLLYTKIPCFISKSPTSY